MKKHLLKFALAIAASTVLASPRNASASASGFKDWDACVKYMDTAHDQCLMFSKSCPTRVTAEMCEDSWEFTSEYCDAHY